jgi:hypothetical protein
VEPWEVAAREEIRDVLARYNANGDAGRFDAVVELFAPDAVMELPGSRTFTGREQIRSVFTGAVQDVRGWRGPMRMQHLTGAPQIDLHDARAARSRCLYQVLMAGGVDHWGRYVDDLGVVDGRWRFTRRRVTVDGFVPGGFGEHTSAHR